MKNKIILADTSILIDYVRKQKKDKTKFYQLNEANDVAISVITEYEFLIGRTSSNTDFLDVLMTKVQILTLDSAITQIAVAAYRELRKRNALIGTNDVFIAATALRYGIPLATLNHRHFTRLEKEFGLQIISH